MLDLRAASATKLSFVSFEFEVTVDLSGCLLLGLRNKMSISKLFCKEIHTCTYIICTVMYACTLCMYMLVHLGDISRSHKKRKWK